MLTETMRESVDPISALTRDTYREIALYPALPDRVAIDLSDNTNLWGAPPAALRALTTVRDEDVARYPVAYEPALAAALADYVGVSADMVACGCGSDDVLDSAIRAFAEPGEVLCLPEPSFSMIPVFARTNGLRPIAIPLTRSFDADAGAMLETDARIIYLCSPNNPTGGALSRKTVERIVERARGLVIIDQAYVEFGGESFTDLASSGRPVLVTRTMSKAFGLAGLRLGYGIGSPQLIAEVLKARGPYKVNALAERPEPASAADLERVRRELERLSAAERDLARRFDERFVGGPAPADPAPEWTFWAVTGLLGMGTAIGLFVDRLLQRRHDGRQRGQLRL